MRTPPGLIAESEAWQREGLITAEQRRAILARYESTADETPQPGALLTWLAAILAGIGGVVLVAWNWTAIPPAAKVAITAGPMLGLYAAAAFAARARRDLIAERLALLAALFAGGVLFVTDDLLHVDSARTYTLPVWALVLAATAALTPSAWTGLVGAAVAGWAMLVAGGSPPPPWWYLTVWPLLAVAVERAPNRWASGSVTLGFGLWVFMVVTNTWNDQPAAPAIAGLLAATWLYTITLAPAARRPAFARATPALVLTLLGLAILLPSGAHRAISDWRLAADRIWPPLALMAALAAGTLWSVSKAGMWRSRPAGLTLLAALWLVAWLTLPAHIRTSAALQWTWTVVFSGATIHLAAAAVRDASRTRDLGQFLVGLAAVAIFVIVRIADARSLVWSGALLIGSAILLWWLGRVWMRPAATEPTP